MLHCFGFNDRRIDGIIVDMLSGAISLPEKRAAVGSFL